MSRGIWKLPCHIDDSIFYKLIVTYNFTAKYWVKEYHVNGFRLDQLALLNASTVKAFVRKLTSIDPHIILYGEPCGQYFTYRDQGEMNIGFFNSYLYNAINGAYHLSSNGFSTGARGKNILIERGVVGETDYSNLCQHQPKSRENTKLICEKTPVKNKRFRVSLKVCVKLVLR